MLFNVNMAEEMRRIILKGTKEQIEAAKIQLLEKVQLYDPVPLKIAENSPQKCFIDPNKAPSYRLLLICIGKYYLPECVSPFSTACSFL